VQIEASPLYLDTSALQDLRPGARQRRTRRGLTGRRDLLISELALTELTAALARRMREGQVDAAAAAASISSSPRRARGEYRLLDLTSATHREAERLLLTLGRHAPLRAADSLHLAAAALADDRALVTYDRLLHAAALAMGRSRSFQPGWLRPGSSHFFHGPLTANPYVSQ